MYIGSNEIFKEEKDIPMKNYVKVSFKDKKTEPQVYAECVMDRLKTEEPMDDTFIREQICTPAAEDINLVMLKYNIKVLDFQHLITLVEESLKHNAKNANKIKWGIEEKQIKILDIHQVLIK